VRAASACVGNDSASFSGPQAAEGNLRVSHTECPPGYATRITNMDKSPSVLSSRRLPARLSAIGGVMRQAPQRRGRWIAGYVCGEIKIVARNPRP